MPMNTPTILLYNLDNPRGQNPPYVPVPAPRTALVPRESYGLPLGGWRRGRPGDALLRGRL